MNTQPRRLTRSQNDRIIAGVCGGMAEHFATSALLFRIIFLVSIAFGGLGILIYLICWLIMPVMKSTEYDVAAAPPRRFYRSAHDKILAGVCAGIAEHFEVDPTLVRIIFIVSTLIFGITLLVYLALWLLSPTRRD